MERIVAVVIILVGFFVLGMWWLESRFGADTAFNVLMGLTHLVAFAAGAVLSFAIGRANIRSINDYARTDAQTDRYRQQTFKEYARGESAMRRAAAQLGVIDARRVDKLANDRARILLSRDREERQNADTWSWDDETEDHDQTYQGEWQ